MPREPVNIESFEKGMISIVEGENIPNEAAAYEENVWGNTDDGKLIGRPGDTLSAKTVASPKGHGWIKRPDGTWELYYYNRDGAAISRYADFYGSPSKSNMSLGISTSYASFQGRNQELHVGLGGSENLPPKWIGFPTIGQFGGAAPTLPICEDAECISPGLVPILDKIHTDGTNIWGIERGGKYLYKITISTGAIARSETGLFQNLQAFCVDTFATTYGWVYDKDSEYGTLHRVVLSSLAIDTGGSHTINSFTMMEGGAITDIAMLSTGTAGTMFASVYHATPAAQVGSNKTFLFRWAVAAGNATLTECTPNIGGGDSFVTGGWCFRTSGGVYAGTAAIMGNVLERTYQLALTPLSATRMGWFAKVAHPKTVFDGSDTGDGFYYVTGAGPAVSIVTHPVFSVSSSAVSGDEAPVIELNDAYAAVDYSGLTYDTSGAKMYLASGESWWQHTIGSIPTTTGTVVDGTSSVELDAGAEHALTSFSTVIYGVRKNEAGIDKDSGSFAGTSVVYDGANIEVAVVNDTGVTGFTANRTYFYRLALEYDGFQLAPLGVGAPSVDDAIGYGKTLTITIADITQLSKRVTAIYVFRSSGVYQESTPDGYYRKVVKIPINSQLWSITESGGITSASYVYPDAVENVGESYEALSGISEALETSIVHYGISAQIGSWLFVAQCYHPDVEEGASMLFRSKPSRFDTFDVTQDFIKLPTVPTAIHAYQGKIWVFDENTIYKINPAGFFVEDTHKGVGAPSQESVAVTEYGMFIADKNNFYVHDGKMPKPLGDRVLTMSDTIPSVTDVSYRVLMAGLYSGTSPWVFYDAKSQYVHIILKKASNYYYYDYAIHINRQRLDLFRFPLLEADGNENTSNVGFIRGAYGELYYANDTNFYSLFDNATRTTFTWISKRFGGDSPNIKKKVYKVKSSGSGLTVTYSKDEAAFTSLSSEKLSAGDRLLNTVRVKVVGTTAGYANALTIIMRELIGKR